MKARKIKEGIYWIGAIDWDRRLFDSLLPLPQGTSYNAYIVQGKEKVALLDTVDPSAADVLLSQLETAPPIDYIISHHAEQDHSGAIPHVLEKYPNARVITTPQGKRLLMELLAIPEKKFMDVEDGQVLSLGNKNLRFIHTPWVHWPETMVTYLHEDNILFTCDFFSCHLATTDLFVSDEAQVYTAAKTFYGAIMMPHRAAIEKNLEKIKRYPAAMIAPSHGPIYLKPAFILEAYQNWVTGPLKNVVVIPYVSMHNSTKKMVEYFVAALAERDVGVEQFNLPVTDIGKMALALVDAATLVIGTPTVLTGPHPSALGAIYLANALRPRLRFGSIIGSYGWGGRVVEQITAMIPNLKVEILPPVMCRGLPKEADFMALDNLATTIAQKHKELNLT